MTKKIVLALFLTTTTALSVSAVPYTVNQISTTSTELDTFDNSYGAKLGFSLGASGYTFKNPEKNFKTMLGKTVINENFDADFSDMKHKEKKYVVPMMSFYYEQQWSENFVTRFQFGYEGVNKSLSFHSIESFKPVLQSYYNTEGSALTAYRNALETILKTNTPSLRVYKNSAYDDKKEEQNQYFVNSSVIPSNRIIQHNNDLDKKINDEKKKEITTKYTTQMRDLNIESFKAKKIEKATVTRKVYQTSQNLFVQAGGGYRAEITKSFCITPFVNIGVNFQKNKYIIEEDAPQIGRYNSQLKEIFATNNQSLYLLPKDSVKIEGQRIIELKDTKGNTYAKPNVTQNAAGDGHNSITYHKLNLTNVNVISDHAIDPYKLNFNMTADALDTQINTMNGADNINIKNNVNTVKLNDKTYYLIKLNGLAKAKVGDTEEEFFFKHTNTDPIETFNKINSTEEGVIDSEDKLKKNSNGEVLSLNNEGKYVNPNTNEANIVIKNEGLMTQDSNISNNAGSDTESALKEIYAMSHEINNKKKVSNESDWNYKLYFGLGLTMNIDLSNRTSFVAEISGNTTLSEKQMNWKVGAGFAGSF